MIHLKLTKKINFDVQWYNFKDCDKCTKYIGLSCVRSYYVLLCMVNHKNTIKKKFYWKIFGQKKLRLSESPHPTPIQNKYINRFVKAKNITIIFLFDAGFTR